MAWWWAVPAVIQGVSAVSQASSAKKQSASAYAAEKFNAQMQYSQNKNNIMNQTMLAGLNFASAGAAAGLNMQLAQYNANVIKNVTDYNVKLLRASTERNIDIIDATTRYNNSLLDEELSQTWENMNLDIKLLQNQRAKEQGQIVAIQAASGTVIGTGSNADVVIDQKTQAALDELVVRHDATRQAENIRREQAKNTWQGGLAMTNLIWEGAIQEQKMVYESKVQAASTLYEGGIAAANIMNQASAQYAGSILSARADSLSNNNQLFANLYNAKLGYSQRSTQISSNLLTGLYGAVGAGAQLYGMRQIANAKGNPVTSRSSYPGGGYTAEGYSYIRGPTLSDPGGSLIGSSSR